MPKSHKLFVHNPGHPDAKSNGIVEYDILCATTRLTGDDKGLVRFVTDKKGWCFYIDNVKHSFVECGGILGKIEKAFDATEGTEFKGWGNTKQYRLTQEEIKSFVLESEEPAEGGKILYYKVFSLSTDLPSKVTGQTQYRGILTL